MADLPATNPGPIQVEETIFKAGVSEYLAQKLGRAINYILNFGLSTVEFNTAGVHNWVAPSGVFRVFVEIIGGGGGGAGGSLGIGGGGGGGGGSSGTMWAGWVNVIPGNSYSITLGAGGAGGAGTLTIYANPGLPGSSSNFDNRIFVDGGLGAPSHIGQISVPPPDPVLGLGGAKNGIFYGRGYRVKGGDGSFGLLGNDGESNNMASGGLAGVASTSNFTGGGGGGAGFDNGGNGGTNFALSQAGSRGSGGGGGLGSNSGTSQAGAAGGAGCCRLTWFGNA